MSRDGVLLLGGTGFIGQALATRLRQRGTEVQVVSRKEVPRLHELLPLCSTVIHLASATTPGTSSAQPALEQVNLNLTRHLLQCLQGRPDIHLIYFSSGGTVYGDPAQLPVGEDAPLAPLSPYGMAKVAQEDICRGLRAHGHAVTILRPSNAYGPGQTIKSGFGLVSTLLENVRLGTAVEVWGDGENVRDFIYIDDLVDATLRLVDMPTDCGTYNLGSGVGHSVNQVKRLVEQVTGLPIKTVHRQARTTDVRAVVLDSARLNRQLGWRPDVELVRGVERTWRLFF
jgi:UDP-glucose 4-epimerase